MTEAKDKVPLSTYNSVKVERREKDQSKTEKLKERVNEKSRNIKATTPTENANYKVLN